VRTSGVVGDQDAPTGADHLCWVDDDPARLVEAVHEFLAEGLRRRERLLCVGSGLADELRSAGEPFGSLDGGLDDLVDRGTLAFEDLAATYTDGEPVRPDEQRAYYVEAVGRAREDGYRGVRVVADVSGLARTPAERAELLRWEQLADEFIASGGGLVAMCVYRRATLDAEALADVTAVHPSVRSPRDVPAFRVWFDEDRVVLAGTVDTFSADRLSAVLAGSPARGPVVGLDLRQLELADVAGCRALAGWGAQLAEQGRLLDLVGAPRVVQRAWQLLGLSSRARVTFSEVPR
jgi:ABC-type transporter Mla MlaB component